RPSARALELADGVRGHRRSGARAAREHRTGPRRGRPSARALELADGVRGHRRSGARAAREHRTGARQSSTRTHSGLLRRGTGARVGTASVRRRAQLLARRPDLAVTPLRGNVDTRLRRWREGAIDALVLAAAGLERLGIAEPAAHALAPEEFLPPVGQGALALECRADAAPTRALLAAVEDRAAATAVAAERAFLLAIGGDCNTPLAAHATVADGRVT